MQRMQMQKLDYIKYVFNMKKTENNIFLSKHCKDSSIKRIIRSNNPIQVIASLFKKIEISNFRFQNHKGKRRIIFTKNTITLVIAIDKLLKNKILIITALNKNYSLNGHIKNFKNKKRGKYAKN